jgi:xanthine dehydrogenase accessory factor
MFEIADRLLAAVDAGRELVVATAISIQGSAPRTVGTSMAFDGAEVIGSIAGGCVEGAVVGVCEEVLSTGIAQTVEYGVSDEDAFSVGLTCGGILRIHVQPLSSSLVDSLRLMTNEPTGIATVISGGGFEARVASELTARIALGETALSTIDCEGESLEVFFEVSTPAPRMIVLGAMEFSTALAAAASVLGYRVTVVDPRPLFATSRRFPAAEVVVQWPTTYLAETAIDERTVVCVLSHDARFDAEAIAIALASPAGYVGAMGSRTTHDRRVASLRERGVTELAKLHSPIGLDLGSSTPEETAISILAEIIAVRTGATVHSLTSTTGPIHVTT